MTKKKNDIPDLGDGDYEIKMTRTNKGEEIKELSFKKKIPEKPFPGQYI